MSDRRLKQNIQPLEGGLEKLLQLHAVTFEWKQPAEVNEPGGVQTGFIAQDVEKVFPRWIGQNAEGYKTLGIPTREFQAMEVEAFRALKAENEALKARLEVLEDGGRPLRAGFARFVNPDKAGWGFGGLMLGLLVANKRKKQS